MKPIYIYLDCETTNLPNNISFSSEELTKMGYSDNSEVDLLLSLALLIDKKEENGKLYIYDSLCKPLLKIDPSASAVHGISNDMVGFEPDVNGEIKNLPPSYKIESYNKLKEIVENNREIPIYIIGHNIDFDIDIIKRVKDDSGKSINFGDNIKLIDTLRVSKHLYNSEKYNKSNSYPDSFGLPYLTYYTSIYKNIPNIKEILNRYNETFQLHSALTDILINRELTLYFMENFNLTIDDLYELSNKPVLYKIMTYGYDRIRKKEFKDISTSDILYMLENYDDSDLKYTCEYILNKRGINNKNNIINFGKYKNRSIEDRSIPDDYLLWAHNEYSNISEDLKKSIKEELKNRGISDPYNIVTFNKEYRGRFIDDPDIPINVLKDGLKFVKNVNIKNQIENVLKERSEIESKSIDSKIVDTCNQIEETSSNDIFDEFFDNL